VRAALALTVILTSGARVFAAPVAGDASRYEHWCARCHGARGDGRGPAAVALALNGVRPRDFTAGRFKIVSVASGSGPTDADLAHTIAEGMPGTPMPYFHDLLTPEEILGLVGVVRSFGPAQPIGAPLDLGPPVPDSAESRARGATLYRDLGCVACHGARGLGDGASASALRASDGSSIRSADLTRPWTFKGGADRAQVAMRLAAGLGGTPMPGYLDAASPADLWDVANFVGSLARAPSLDAAAAALARRPPGDGQPPRARGEYVVKSSTCFLCHVQMNSDGSYVEGSFGAGGMRVTIAHVGTLFTRNLTPDSETGLGGWSADDLRRALREGRSRDGRALSPLDMPWTVFSALDDADIDAAYAYLQSLPPVRNLVPVPEGPGPWDGIVTKARALLAGDPMHAGYHPSNAGRVPAEGEHPAPIRNPLGDEIVAVASLVVLAAYLVLRRRRGRIETASVSALLLVIPLVYTWPPLRWMPAALVKAEPPFETVSALFGLPPVRHPPPAVRDGDDDTEALAERGRYVATIGACPLCHTAGPNPVRLWAPYPEMGGGMRVTWQVFGTTYSRNLTPDGDTGLGPWSKPEIKRAIQSGIARDGRIMHWQAMPWDHFANLTPEDLEALVVYLQHLPPVFSTVPAPAPPSPGDPDADTFWFAYSGEYRR
jgi:mono/diheme cytochrome c family protein